MEKPITIEECTAITGDKLIIHEDDTKDEIAYKQAKIITKAFNFIANGGKEWIKQPGEYAYFPVAWRNKPGVGFVFGNSFYVRDFTGVGSRLEFKESEDAETAFNTFIEVYRNLFL